MTTYDRREVASIHGNIEITDDAGSSAADAIARLKAEVERLREDRNCEKRLRKDAEERAEEAEARQEAVAPILLRYHAIADTFPGEWGERNSEVIARGVAALRGQVARLERERDEALTSNAKWQEEWRLARSERDEALKDAHAWMRNPTT